MEICTCLKRQVNSKGELPPPPPLAFLILLPCAQGGTQVASFVLHGETVLWGHVQLVARNLVELQALNEDGQEEKDLSTANGLTDATPLAHAEDHHPLALQLVQLCAVSGQEAFWHEGVWILPLRTEGRQMKKNV